MVCYPYALAARKHITGEAHHISQRADPGCHSFSRCVLSRIVFHGTPQAVMYGCHHEPLVQEGNSNYVPLEEKFFPNRIRLSRAMNTMVGRYCRSGRKKHPQKEVRIRVVSLHDFVDQLNPLQHFQLKGYCRTDSANFAQQPYKDLLH